MEHVGTPAGPEDESGISQHLAEALAGLDARVKQAIMEVIILHRQFPAWAVWLPHGSQGWVAVRPASTRAPGPELPLVWVHGASPTELGARMHRVDTELSPG
jgi:hypothetical protein